MIFDAVLKCSVIRKGYELEREGNLFKAKFVALLSDKFKVVPSKWWVGVAVHCIIICIYLCRPSRRRGEEGHRRGSLQGRVAVAAPKRE